MPYFPNCSLDGVANNVHEVNSYTVVQCSTDQMNDSHSYAFNVTVMAKIMSLSNCPQLTVNWKCMNSCKPLILRIELKYCTILIYSQKNKHFPLAKLLMSHVKNTNFFTC